MANASPEGLQRVRAEVGQRAIQVGTFTGGNKRQIIPWFQKLEFSQFSFPSSFPSSIMSFMSVFY